LTTPASESDQPAAIGARRHGPDMETPAEKLQRVLRDRIDLVAYDPRWSAMFEEEKRRLRAFFPDLIGRVEHFGSTAVPGLRAKPIVDLLVEVSSLDAARNRIAPVLEAAGYDDFWRATHGDDGPPFYAWFIKRDAEGVRTPHLHRVETDSEHWDRLRFRDYLISHPDCARRYQEIKLRLASEHSTDRVAYTRPKTEFIVTVTAAAKADPR
jgi:GrpB-like predicted nucleotidyltransferase (UPF0157 family)